MEEPVEPWLQILKENAGFAKPEKWVAYAKEHNFKRVPVTKVEACPDCGEAASQKVGQFVYYSNLIALRRCRRCDLMYSDLLIDRDAISRHFDTTYVDEGYFTGARKDIFAQLAELLSSCVPPKGSIIDVGGAKGHLMAAVRQLRPDVHVVVNDTSASKCEWAERHYGFRTICGTAAQACSEPELYDAVALIDVIYYEPDLLHLWKGIGQMLRPRGTLVLRIPNHYRLIGLWSWWGRCLSREAAREMEDRIPLFNPEHLFVVTKQYLRFRLRQLGFTRVDVIPSALLVNHPRLRPLYKVAYYLAKALYVVSLGRLAWTPSIIVIARRT